MLSTPQLTDSHCHLDRIDLTSFDGKIENVLKAAQEMAVQRFLCVNIDLEHFSRIQALSQQYPNIYCSVGVHPTAIDTEEPSVEKLITLAQTERVIAIGETGLDYFRLKKEEVDWQRKRFRRHIRAANQCKKPLIIHTRSAREDTLRILKEEQAQQAQGVMHCFAEDWETAKQAMDLGFYISFSGIITFKNAADLREVAQKVPEDFLLVETDSPWLAPVPKRGKLNQPAYTRYVAEKLAEIRGVSFEHIAELTEANFQRLFQI